MTVSKNQQSLEGAEAKQVAYAGRNRGSGLSRGIAILAAPFKADHFFNGRSRAGGRIGCNITGIAIKQGMQAEADFFIRG